MKKNLLMQSTTCLFLCLIMGSAHAVTFKTPMKPLPVNNQAIQDDLNLIAQEAKLPTGSLTFEFTDKVKDISLRCDKDRFILQVSAPDEEKTASVYKGLREMGFYFPHPRRQISPTLAGLKKKCGMKTAWKPTLRFRGFHLHTLHPSEWVSAFYQNQPKVAEATVRWLARNNQNLMDLNLLREPLEEMARQMRPPFELARSLQIYTGVSLGVAFQQQNSYKLITVLQSFFGFGSEESIQKGLEKLIETFPLSYMVLEKGTSEFTPTNFEKTLDWLNFSGAILKKHNIVLQTKVHVSTNQVSKKWGNYNFLPQYAERTVGVLPHTVMFYSMLDQSAPMYGNKNFHAIREFTLKEKEKRPTWYYPETSYWVAMDMDVPLFLTDYLVGRAQDIKWLHENQVEGHLNFSTGQALGYWLFDWNVALMSDGDYQFDPTTALRLLGEDLEVWKPILAYQTHWYKEKGIIAMISAANLQDELSGTHRIHDRFTMRDLSNSPKEVEKEVSLLEESLKSIPKLEGIKDQELKSLLRVTQLRQEQSLMLRYALNNTGTKVIHLSRSKTLRTEAKDILAKLTKLPTNYPELPIYEETWHNPTSYKFGYLFGAASLYWWEREERQISEDSYFPFFHNMYDVIDILF